MSAITRRLKVGNQKAKFSNAHYTNGLELENELMLFRKVLIPKGP